MQHRNIAMVVAIVATIVAVILISGYTLNPFISNSQPAPQVTVTEKTTVMPSPSPSENTASKDEVFAQAFTADYEQQFGETPSDALVINVTEIAKSSCVYLKSHTWEKFKREMAKVIVSASSDNDVRTRLAWSIGYAVGFYCPEYVGQ